MIQPQWAADNLLKEWESFKREKDLIYVIYKMNLQYWKNGKEPIIAEHICNQSEINIKLKSGLLSKHFNTILTYFIRVNKGNKRFYNKIYFSLIKQYIKFDKEYKNHCQIFIDELLLIKEPRYSVIKINHKILFIGWFPDIAKPKQKMIYASLRETFMQSLVGLQYRMQASDADELTEELIYEKCRDKTSKWMK
eukprot:380512_1